ncbi:polysaccharide deacetylase family protein [Psychrobacter lutiphocae]|uniref:polysaccharide deacetylase family protein n=1 Tax=Psychrobacter lutiphocae TaxID=540500 RepID=UPI000476686C|nr:polysaccharide deacetylase family protein [Psychrobacter lutiphocae]
MVGYGSNPPDPKWPGGAKIAVQFVLNIEEGAENNVIHGDGQSERFLSDILGTPSFDNRHQSIESAFEYGSRVGVWRVLDAFKQYNFPITTFVCASAAVLTPHIIDRVLKDGHEIASHGLRWITYQNMYRETEREHIRQATEIFQKMLGYQPSGWYTGRDSPNTRELVVEQGGYLYDSDSYADELPYWVNVKTQQGDQIVRKPHLVIPYSLETNDMRFASSPGFTHAEPFYQYLKDSFDTLYAEANATDNAPSYQVPKMLSIGLHCRMIGRAGRISALQRFLKYISDKPDVWVCRRDEIAKHWYQQHPATADNTANWL